ncbi:hypothetical protein [Halegenticoccus tardaugens]|uniref:hypothetical protein n=1 Tax=Halegenticoccus tardaugens TaxID=2071624 RepID=UPI00100C1EF3|nr:hypothetical protein [Halegenticoccus tardaugens]
MSDRSSDTTPQAAQGAPGTSAANETPVARVRGVRVRETAFGPRVELLLDNRLWRDDVGDPLLDALLDAFGLDSWHDAGWLYGRDVPVTTDEHGRWCSLDEDALERMRR